MIILEIGIDFSEGINFQKMLKRERDFYFQSLFGETVENSIFRTMSRSKDFEAKVQEKNEKVKFSSALVKHLLKNLTIRSKNLWLSNQ